jgi:hypothetical protein
MNTDVNVSLKPDPVIEEYKKHVDRTLLRQNLKLTVTQRFEQLIALQALAEEVHRAGKEAKRKGGFD